MRIAVIAPPWLPVPPHAYGGTEMVLDTLCRGLVAAGHQVLLYTTGDSTCPVERAWSHERSVGTKLFAPAAELRQVIDGYAAVAAWGADIVHDHTIYGPLYADRHLELPIVTTNHGVFAGDLAVAYRAMAERSSIVAISHHQASTADVPIAAVIHHGVDLDRYPVGTGRGDHALFLGRMSPDKGVHTAARVARRAGIKLLIAAKMQEPGEHEYFHDVVEPLLDRDIEYIGEVGHDAKVRLLGEARCLLNPVGWPEPFGMVSLEALACGTPVLATPVGAIPEVVDDGRTGILRSDVEALARGFRNVVELDRAACREATESRFSMARLTADHVALYERVLAG